MCLIAVAWQAHPRFRLALVANRDEAHARPSAAAGFDPEAPTVYGGRDLQAGGSWLQVSTRGRLAAVTNVRVGRAAEAAPCSRGVLVRDFVRSDASCMRWLQALGDDARDYGRFNLLAWDGTDLCFASNHPLFSRHAVAPGVHAMSNGAFDASWPKAGHAARMLEAWLGGTAGAGANAGTADIDFPAMAPLFAALADTTPAPDVALPDTGVGLALERALSPAFVRDATYGTRCSSVVLVDAVGITFAERRFGANGTFIDDSVVHLPLALPTPDATGARPR